MQRGVRERRSHGNRAKCSFSTCSAARWTHRSGLHWAQMQAVLLQFSRAKRCRYCFLKPLLRCLVACWYASAVAYWYFELWCSYGKFWFEFGSILFCFFLSLFNTFFSPFLLLQNTEVELESLEACCPFKSPQVSAQQRAKHIPHSLLASCAAQIWGTVILRW